MPPCGDGEAHSSQRSACDSFYVINVGGTLQYDVLMLNAVGLLCLLQVVMADFPQSAALIRDRAAQRVQELAVSCAPLCTLFNLFICWEGVVPWHMVAPAGCATVTGSRTFPCISASKGCVRLPL